MAADARPGERGDRYSCSAACCFLHGSLTHCVTPLLPVQNPKWHPPPPMPSQFLYCTDSIPRPTQKHWTLIIGGCNAPFAREPLHRCVDTQSLLSSIFSSCLASLMISLGSLST